LSHNPRSLQEGWNIEPSLRHLRQRLTDTACTLLLAGGLLLTQAPCGAVAATPADAARAAPSGVGPNSARLLNQPLNSQNARQDALRILNQPPFVNRPDIPHWRLTEKATEEEGTALAADSGVHPHARPRLGLPLATPPEVLLWALLLGFSLPLAWRYRHWTSLLSRGFKQHPVSEHRFDSQSAAQGLPNDIATYVENLWEQNPRAALGLLYCALLNQLSQNYGLALKRADTESQVLNRLHTLDNPGLITFSQSLTHYWQALAYGHRTPPETVCRALCDEWRRLLGAREQP
jgi:hypothetical protein